MKTVDKLLIKDTLIYAIGDIGIKLVGFILLPIYTRELTPSEYGSWDLIQTLQMIVLPMMFLQITDGVYRLLLSKDSNNKDIIYTSSIFILVCIFILLLLGTVFLSLFNLPLDFIILILIFYFAQGVFQYLLQVARGLNLILFYSISGIVAALIAALTTIILIKIYHYGFTGIIIGTTTGIICGSLSLLYFCKLWKYFNLGRFDKTLLKKLLRFSIPLIPNAISWWVINFSDRIILKYFVGMGAVGIYGISVKIASLVFFINSIFNKAWLSNSITSFENKNSNEERTVLFSETFNKLLILQFIGIIILTAGTYYFGDIILGSEFTHALPYIPLLAIAAVFQSFTNFYGSIYWGVSNTKGALNTTIFASGANLLLNMIFIPYYGIIAAVFSTIVSFIILWILRGISTRKYVVINLNYWNFLIGMLLFCGVYLNLFFTNTKFLLQFNLFIALSLVTYIIKILLKRKLNY